MLEIFIDADACPVKQEIFRVAQRYGLSVTVVANSSMQIPNADWIRLVVVEGQFDAADDWIVKHAAANDIVISGDIPLAARCLEKGTRVIGLRGDIYPPLRIPCMVSSRCWRKRDRSRFSKGAGPPVIVPSSRRWASNARLARAPPIESRVKISPRRPIT